MYKTESGDCLKDVSGPVYSSQPQQTFYEAKNNQRHDYLKCSKYGSFSGVSNRSAIEKVAYYCVTAF